MTKARAVLALASMFLAVGLAQQSFAQYQPVIGSITATASGASATAGGSVQVTCLLRDPAGNVMSGQDNTFTISNQPGSSAQLTPLLAQTNAQGMATTTLNVGTQAGQIVVSCSAGELTSRVIVDVLGIQVTSVAVPAAPNTGDGGLATSPDNFATLLLALIAASVLLATLKVAATKRS